MGCGVREAYPPAVPWAPGVTRGAQGVPRGADEAWGGPIFRDPHRCAKPREDISRIRMVVARASGTLIASSLKQNTFLTLGVCPGGRPRGTPGRGGRGGADGEPRGGPCDGVPPHGMSPPTGTPSVGCQKNFGPQAPHPQSAWVMILRLWR